MFKINIKATNIELNSTINEYINKKLNSLKKFIKKADSEPLFEIEVGRTSRHHRQGDIFRAEIKLRLDGKNFYASSEKDDLYASIDEVKDEIKNELLSNKTKKETLLRKGGAKIKSIMRGTFKHPRS